MSDRVAVDLFCPSCHAVQHLSLPTLLDLGANPNLQYGILTDSVFTHTCGQCHASFQVEHELIVLHRDAGYALLLAPEASEETDQVPATDPSLDGLALRLVRTTAQLKEKVLVFESLLDDRTIELVKLYLAVRQVGSEGTSLLFTEHRDGQMTFSVLGPDGALESTVSAPDDLYRSLDKKGKSFPVPAHTFVRVDSLWTFKQISR